MSFNPLSEARYRYKLALDHFERAKRLFSLKDWAGTVSAVQLAVENFSKTVIAVFEVPTWSHDPSHQLTNLIEKLSSGMSASIKELANLARKLAPEHGRSSYGEPSIGLTPSDLYKGHHALNALENSKKAKKITEDILRALNIKL